MLGLLEKTFGRGDLFRSHLLAAARAGHLCVQVDGSEIVPDPRKLWGASDEEIEAILQDVGESPGVVCDGRRFYLKRHWEFETTVLEEVRRLEQSEPTIPLSPKRSEGLLDQQWEAVEKGAKFSLSIITGGPGTGKTFTAGHLLKALGGRIAVAAPTGKAAGNLQRVAPHLEVKTLHSLLREKKVWHPADLILVDEASMIDAEMMAKLFSSVKKGARLVLMGDADQLPPVDTGNFFAELIKALPERVTCLTKCLRTDNRELLALASQVRDGVCNDLPLVGELKTDFPSPCVDEAREEHLEAFNRFRILSPVRKGRLGVDGLNQRFLKEAEKEYCSGKLFLIPIMISSNDYELGLFNGEVGLLVHSEPGKPTEALFSGGRRVPAPLLPNHELAYCLSVHKSQGSEFGKVLFVVPEGVERFGRELFYTAITRAKFGVEIFGKKEHLLQIVERKPLRLSGLGSRLACC